MHRIAGVAIAIALIAGCQQRSEIAVDRPWVRLAAVPSNPSAAYFTLKGGPRDETLTGVSAPAAVRTEMHESMGQGGMMTMAPLKLVSVRAGDSVSFAPGGKHVMLFGLKPQVQPGTNTLLTLTFASGPKITVSARVVGAGDSAPGD
ncbi:MAG: copper chaperone PCu(A)C [Sphingomonas sp.]|uniref:copper chaperone PCu(A)C n=1 Tax=Sphingomonas sp. TaxID=28214 RepID=UPI0011FACAE5|nr:copper chaperone PCu(A)C [Sphingomonas sp.]THD37366.1 MAG: copper chaperone PCu(A)C [Sphingomonas sp.]